METSAVPALEVIKLHTRFGDKVIHEELNLKVHSGSITVIIGGSGAGKSVLLKCLCGLMVPTAGEIIVFGKTVTTGGKQLLAASEASMGVLFQNGALFDNLNVFDNVAFPIRRMFNLKHAEIKEKVSESLSLVGLTGMENKMVNELSVGMIKRAALARTIIWRPKIILYDEPTTGIDPILADVVNNLILEMQTKIKATSILVTHDMKSAMQVGDRIAMLHNGRFIFDGLPHQLSESENIHVQRFITSTAPDHDMVTDPKK